MMHPQHLILALAATTLGFTARASASLIGTNFGVANINQTFDYVVVGGGNAGLAIASRLSEDPSVSVAVVEAGMITYLPTYLPTYLVMAIIERVYTRRESEEKANANKRARLLLRAYKR
jgi:choline dehydrogenase-like flavoprotein